MTSVEFGRREVANDVRNRLEDFLDEDDSRRSKTVKLQDRVPDELVQRVREEAADSREVEADKAGQASLSDRERREIDFSKEGVNVPFARSVKGIAKTEGVEDWLQFADFDLSVDENRSVLARAGREERGDRGRGRTAEQSGLRKARRAKRQRRDQAEQAKEPAFGGDTEAAAFLREEQRFEDDLFDISLRGGPSGRDFERLEDAHERRSERAKRVDERRSAQVTRDPLKWAQNKAKYDYPGIDTVQPSELHNERSAKAQRVDEREQAPIADSREQWAQNPDEFDWRGVDTKRRPTRADTRETLEEMRSAKNDVLYRLDRDDINDEVRRSEAAERGVEIEPDRGMKRVETAGVTGLSPYERDQNGFGADLEEAGGARSGTVPEPVVENFAAGREADMAFVSAEEDRGSDAFDMSAEGGVLADTRDEQASLDVGRAAGVTEDRSGEIAGSAGFEDRRDELRGGSDPGEQAGLGIDETNVGGEGQTDLFGNDASESSGGEYLK